ncbi:hypothetical protein BKA67DRAFT_656605 [Truncatella angustata]|uniref:Uncharacterized protein n=1 Tax=Truncatella angustata TaxID=152316 RepID=A0A9P9A1J9_9PEZI|nr:uncharacterized protein BKA67DRAFT_656605 [Truncatella angustata]KAH6658413.1 hypothetical protein BKA67DRAFT_656605 [Truncatella angustata]KAH8201591.1 hypothetical protein TruAng_004197 [Truncatella angustata]
MILDNAPMPNAEMIPAQMVQDPEFPELTVRPVSRLDCTTPCLIDPRGLYIEDDFSPFTVFTGADGIVTFLRMHNPATLRAFLDLVNVSFFEFTWFNTKFVKGEMLPFIIKRDNHRVQAGYKRGYKGSTMGKEWDMAIFYDMWSNGIWQLKNSTAVGLGHPLLLNASETAELGLQGDIGLAVMRSAIINGLWKPQAVTPYRAKVMYIRNGTDGNKELCYV